MERNLNFDVAKAICIILVVLGHYFPDDSPIWYVNLRFLIYMFHMPLFLFASGYIYESFKKNESYLPFVTKKIKRLMVPYFVTSIIIITIKLLTQKGMLVENPVTLSSYVKMFYIPEAGYFLWFVWSLFTMFLIVPVLKSKTIRIIVFAIAVLLHYLPFDLTPVFALAETKRMFVWFMLGVICSDNHVGEILRRIKRWKYAVYLIVIAAFGILGAVDMYKYAMYLSWLGIAMVMSVSSLIASMPKESRLIKLFIILSSSSYIIYLFHTTFEGFAKSIVNKFFVSEFVSNGDFVLKAAVVVVCGVVFPILLHKFVLVRYSWLKFLFGLK